MANIMITERCNLRCPYCFANEFVGKSTDDISMDNFVKALDFALTNENEEIGIIGGEPTVHSKLKEMLELIIHDERVQSCTLFTNGILLDRYFNQIIHPKFKILINCNSPMDIGEDNYEKMVENIEILSEKYYMSDRITLGINMYKPDFDYDYIIKLLKDFGYLFVRTSISVPNNANDANSTSLNHFRIMKPRVIEFYHKLLNEGILPFYDCNAIPKCIFTPQEYKSLEQKIEALEREDINFTSELKTCSPVIDILPDLSIIRCFALSQQEKAKIGDFENIQEARAYFNYCFDTLAYHINADSQCGDCKEKTTMKCTGGCYAFKVHEIINLKEKFL
jgi:sulfatase maturation enzyme AslB (radical SAM superfamily)